MKIRDLIGFVNPTTQVLLYQMSYNEPCVRENIYYGCFGTIPKSLLSMFLNDISVVSYSTGPVLEMFGENLYLRKR